jgi:hypothetical protein
VERLRGQTRFWEQSLEPMTLVSAIAALYPASESRAPAGRFRGGAIDNPGWILRPLMIRAFGAHCRSHPSAGLGTLGGPEDLRSLRKKPPEGRGTALPDQAQRSSPRSVRLSSARRSARTCWHENICMSPVSPVSSLKQTVAGMARSVTALSRRGPEDGSPGPCSPDSGWGFSLPLKSENSDVVRSRAARQRFLSSH